MSVSYEETMLSKLLFSKIHFGENKVVVSHKAKWRLQEDNSIKSFS